MPNRKSIYTHCTWEIWGESFVLPGKTKSITNLDVTFSFPRRLEGLDWFLLETRGLKECIEWNRINHRMHNFQYVLNVGVIHFVVYFNLTWFILTLLPQSLPVGDHDDDTSTVSKPLHKSVNFKLISLNARGFGTSTSEKLFSRRYKVNKDKILFSF